MIIRNFILITLIGLWLWVGIFWGVSAVFAQQPTLREMVNNSRYWPPACEANVCVLTGLGGIVGIWTAYVEKNTGKRFIVTGICASACELAYQLALKNGEQVIIKAGARLIVHAPRETIFK